MIVGVWLCLLTVGANAANKKQKPKSDSSCAHLFLLSGLGSGFHAKLAQILPLTRQKLFLQAFFGKSILGDVKGKDRT
jgi:hypothetical protein